MTPGNEPTVPDGVVTIENEGICIPLPPPFVGCVSIPLEGSFSETATKGYWECIDPDTPPANGGTCIGFGPYVMIVRPDDGDVVSGQVRVEIAVSDSDVGGRPIGVFVDKQLAPLTSYFEQLPSTEICDTALGGDPGCPYVGFAGMLDTTVLSDGTHQLQVLAQRDDPINPFLSWQELEFEVRNQTQPAQPEIIGTEGWAGNTRIPNDGTYSYSFGERHIDTFPFVAPFLICNLGTDDLDLLNHSTMVTGSGFSREFGSPASFVGAQRCSQLNVRFDVDDPGIYTGTVSIVSNDPDDSPFTFAISGEAISTDSAPPRLNIDLPVANEVLAGSILVSGWALDDGDLAASDIGVKLNGSPISLSGFTYGDQRSDVCAGHADLGSPDCPGVGWSGWLNTAMLPDGAHRLEVTASDATSQSVTQTRWFSSEHTPQGQAPLLWMAIPGHNEVLTGFVTLSGWVLAETTLTTADLRFYLDGRPILPGNPLYGVAKPWVCNAHPELPAPDCPDVGWRADGHSTAISNGPHTLQLFVQDQNGSLSVFTRSFFVQN